MSWSNISWSLRHSMASCFPFEYFECLSDTVLSKLPERLLVKEKDNPELLLILRLLSGVLTLEHVSSTKRIYQKDNYFSSDLKGISRSWSNSFPELLGEGYTAEKLSMYIESSKFKNRKFYKNILSELSYFFYYQKIKVHSSAFVYLYRALEHVSYAFPLIYVSKTDDFSGSYRFLKDLMSGEKEKGELGFLKKFVNTIYRDDSIRESSVDFDITLSSEQEHIFGLLKSLCRDNMISDSTVEPQTLSIKYTEVGSFFILIRNRFFHFMNGGANNIETSRLSDIDLLFGLLNKSFLYWLSTLLLAVVSHNALEFDEQQFRLA